MKTDLTHYEVLGVASDATEDEIKRAYRKVMKEHHPDVASGAYHEDYARMATMAKSVLLNHLDRRDYNDELRRTGKMEEEVRYSYSETVEDDHEETRNSSTGSSGYGSSSPDVPFEEKLWGAPGTKGYSPGEPIQKMGSPIIPDEFVEKSPRFISGMAGAWTTLGVTVASLLAVVFFALSISDAFVSIGGIASIAAAVSIFYSGRLRKPLFMLPWWGVAGITATLVGTVAALTSFSNIEENILRVITLIIAPVLSIVFSGTFWGFVKNFSLMKPKSLRANNSFGTSGNIRVEELIDETLNPFWGVKGVKVFRFARTSFSHMVVFGNRVVLLKGVNMVPGALSMFEGSVYNQSGPGRFDKLLDSGFLAGLFTFCAKVSPKIEITPMVVAYPGGNLLSFDPDPNVTFVAGDDAAALIAQVLFREGAENKVDHSTIVELLNAVNA